MKRPRREAVGGEVALMAVITKAMGAFLILVVIMLPHYVFSVSSSKTADQAQERADNASKTANEISDALKKGRLTDAEIDELLRKIEALKTELATLNDEIAQLKNELNQALAEVKRLKEAKEELEEEVARLKKELEELRKNVRPSSQFVLSWSNCPGAEIQLYVWSSALIDQNGKSEPQPSVSRTSQGPAGTKDTQNGTGWSKIAENGHVWWRTLDKPEDETFAVWAKLLNPISLASSRARICPVAVTMATSEGKQANAHVKLSDDQPFSLALVARRGADGSLRVDPIDPADQTPYRAAFASPCEGLMCFAKGTPAPDGEREKMKSAFVADIRRHLDVNEGIVGKVFDSMASGDITVADGFRWLNLFPSPDAVPSTIDAERLSGAERVLKSMFERKRALPDVQAGLLSEFGQGRLDRSQFFGGLEGIRDGNSSRLYDQFTDNKRANAAADLRRRGIFDGISARLRKSVDDDVAANRLSDAERLIIQNNVSLSSDDPTRKSPRSSGIEAELSRGQFSPGTAAVLKELIQADVFSIDGLSALVNELDKTRRSSLSAPQIRPPQPVQIPQNLPPLPKMPAVKHPSSTPPSP